MEYLNEPTLQDQERTWRIFQALGNPKRLSIVYFLAQGEQTVSEIAAAQKSKISNVSRHLAKLKEAGVLRSRKSGLTVYYSLNMPYVSQMLHNVRVFLARTR